MEIHTEAYRVAFESAKSELMEISAEFEKLRLRKDHMERLLAVLMPLIGEDAAPVPGPQEDSVVKPAESAGEPSGTPHGGPEGLVADPFQRRIDHVLGIGAGIRDVRKYSRQF